jgi:peptidoglycan/xylan/chitin deacetylase (PgdA/CDA1 family)
VEEPLVLCYHGVSARWPGGVPPERLRAQLQLLLARGYRGVGFGEAMRARTRRVLAVTFDDAYRSVLERGLPVLEALGVPATVFVPTDFAGVAPAAWPGTDVWLGTAFEDELAVMTWAELDRLASAGWEIGSHSCSHPRLTELDDAALDHELRASRARVEAELQRPCTSLAYPYGDWDQRVAAAAAAAGYRAACTLPESLHRPSALAWPRVGIYRRDGARIFQLKVSTAVRRLRRTRAWAIARPAKWRRPEEHELRRPPYR